MLLGTFLLCQLTLGFCQVSVNTSMSKEATGKLISMVKNLEKKITAIALQDKKRDKRRERNIVNQLKELAKVQPIFVRLKTFC